MASTWRSGSHDSEAQEPARINYLDGSVLLRDIRIPNSVYVVTLVVSLVAAVIGGSFLLKTSDSILHADERKAEAIHANLTRDVSLELPSASTLADSDIDAANEYFADSGYQTIDLSNDEQARIVKIPSDASTVDAKVAFAAGIDKMNGETASKYLPGTWIYSSSYSGFDKRLRYCDFASPDATAAVQAAMDAQGWIDGETVTVTDEGQDSIGNIYQEGTFETDRGDYSWRISACPLSAVYSISGLPANVSYVGIHMMQA